MLYDTIQNKDNPLHFINKPQFISIVPANFIEGVIYESHTHEYTEIMLITDGQGTQIIDGTSYQVKAGDVVLLNQYCIHAEQSNKTDPVSLVTCKLDKLKISGMRAGQIVSDSLSPIISSGSMFEELTDCFNEMYYEKSFSDEYSNILIDANLQRMFCMIFRLMKEAPIIHKSERIDNLIYSVKQYIDEHYTEDISLEFLSSHFFVSVSFLVHAFKREIGKSPINYLIDRRIGEAQRYLSFTNISVAEISERIGYENVSYFNKVFLKRTGFQPSVFRELYSFKKHMDSSPSS